jgi:phospholipid/cholesterol/gamma-HCH transport system substrate-binding protein
LNSNLAKVGDQLASERQELGAALSNLATALSLVNQFVADNRTRLTTDIHKLTTVTNVLTKEKEAVTEIIDMAPIALSNLSLAYDPKAGTLDTKDDANAPFQNPTSKSGVLCQLFMICTTPAGVPTRHTGTALDLLRVRP